MRWTVAAPKLNLAPCADMRKGRRSVEEQDLVIFTKTFKDVRQALNAIGRLEKYKGKAAAFDAFASEVLEGLGGGTQIEDANRSE